MIGRTVGALPLAHSAAREAGALGALTLDANEAVATYSLFGACFPCLVDDTSPACCTCESTDRETCFSREGFYVPFPWSCCGADCACCPSAPRGEAWQAALAGGFGPLLAEAGPLARSVKLTTPDYDGLVALAQARAALLSTHWLPRANAVLAGHGLRAAAFSYVFVKVRSEGRGGWGSRTVLQFYDDAIYKASQQGRGGVVALTGAAKPAA
jgi:hypothetical protein